MYYPKQIPYLLDQQFKENVAYTEYYIEELKDYCMCIWTMKSKKTLDKTIANNIYFIYYSGQCRGNVSQLKGKSENSKRTSQNFLWKR